MSLAQQEYFYLLNGYHYLKLAFSGQLSVFPVGITMWHLKVLSCLLFCFWLIAES